MYPVSYEEWNEEQARVERHLLDVRVPREELFLRKLVNATVIHNRLYEHSSHESEDDRKHFVYAKPFDERSLRSYGPAVLRAVFETSEAAAEPSADCYYWRDGAFVRGQPAFPVNGALDIAERLLDHYRVEYGRTHEAVYAVWDEERKKALFFLKEVAE